MSFAGQVVIVTGGASGIGRAISLLFAKAGATVIINYNHSEAKAKALCEELIEAGCNCKAKQADISDFTQAEALVEMVMSEYGRVDILINNAGITKDNLLLRMTETDFDTVINTNLKGTWNMCKAVVSPMIRARIGKIINIVSVAGLIGNAGQSNYAASKAGIVGLTKSLARELAKRNITCNAVAPGFIDTKMTESLPDELKQKYLEQIPSGRFGTPLDVAEAVLFLASDQANYITGQVINVDGGMVMG